MNESYKENIAVIRISCLNEKEDENEVIDPNIYHTEETDLTLNKT